MDKLNLEELKAIATLADLCRADWERRPTIIGAFLKAAARGVVTTEDTLAGQPRLEGTRLSVDWIRAILTNVSVDDVLEDYPQLIRADLEPFITSETQRPEEWWLYPNRLFDSAVPYHVFTFTPDAPLPPGVKKHADGFVVQIAGELHQIQAGNKLIVSRKDRHMSIWTEEQWEDLVARKLFSKTLSASNA